MAATSITVAPTAAARRAACDSKAMSLPPLTLSSVCGLRVNYTVAIEEDVVWVYTEGVQKVFKEADLSASLPWRGSGGMAHMRMRVRRAGGDAPDRPSGIMRTSSMQTEA
jgi:hypothetical protein